MTQPPDPRYAPVDPQGYPPQDRSRGGFFPVPHRSWQTKGGSRVTVGGCCLPLPIGCLTLVGAAALAAASSVRARRA